MKKSSKKKKTPRFSMRAFFSLFFIIALLAIDVCTSLVIFILIKYIPFISQLPKPLWMILISVVLGSIMTTFLAKCFFDPIETLRAAMCRVAEGDFTVRLEEDHLFPEIRQIHQAFNVMTQRLASTEILQTDFISNVSHEFKTPINAIEGYAMLLQDTDQPTTKEQNTYIDKILFNTRRLTSLVGNILLLSKVDNQQLQLTPSTFRLDEQIRQSIVSLEPRWMKKNTEFDVDMECLSYTGSASLLMHVWNNLIENAIKYGPQDGLVHIRLTRCSDQIQFTIDDEGPGIPPDAKERIVDRFYQADSSRKEDGNGLGLALVHRILGLVSGSIHVENLPEKGCRFTVLLNAPQDKT